MPGTARRILVSIAAIVLAACSTPAAVAPLATATPEAAPGRTQLLWLGQSGYRITTPGGKTIVIDPYLTAGPRAPAPYKTDPAALGKIDLLLVTHAHADHLGDAPMLAKLNDTPIYGPADMVTALVSYGLIPANLGYRFNKSGSVQPLPGITVTPVHADHSSILVSTNPVTGKSESHAAGEPVGFIIELENGFRIWHMGDTGLFSDMEFISEHYKPDLVLIPIGGNFTMGPADAAFAERNWIRSKYVIPMHYGSTPVAKGTLPEFQAAMTGAKTAVVPMVEGQTVTF